MIDIFVVPDLWNVLAQWGATLVLFLVLRHFIYKPMMDFLEKRKSAVMADMNDAKASKAEADALKEQYEAQMAGARKEGQSIIEESRKRGQAIEQEHLNEGKKKADQLLEKAQSQIQDEKRKALADAKAETADLALLIAQKLMGQSMDATKQKDLVDGLVKDLEGHHGR
ncbi:MAG: F0F1 ATP synthase subunit B [Tissierellia bacterium]|nr:F0F1 ATP synthase subunit B [Tissierellia bacterium]